MKKNFASPSFDFWQILKGTSRSFYLSLYLLPPSTRKTIALAYALARAADTLCDTPFLKKEEKAIYLESFEKSLKARRENKIGLEEERLLLRISQMETNNSMDINIQKEHRLLSFLSSYLQEFSLLEEKDLQEVDHVLSVIIEGMKRDLAFEGDEFHIHALPDFSDLDLYCYRVAGVVGEFWTRVHFLHFPLMRRLELNPLLEKGIRFGKALQMTNILRDIPSDLKKGRCYLPASALHQYGLEPSDLLDPERSKKILPLYHELLFLTLDHYRAGVEYFLSLPPSLFRLRLSTLLPLAIGIKTIGLLFRAKDLHSRAKIQRKEVYQLLIQSLVALPFSEKSKSLFNKLFQEIQ